LKERNPAKAVLCVTAATGRRGHLNGNGRGMLKTQQRRLIATTSLAGSMAAFTFGAALAQNAAPPKAGIEEVVVTAEKRTSTVQKTPMSITAITGAMLHKQGITTLEQVVRDVPGISMRSAGPGQTELEMRGLASSGGSAPTVGYYLNDVPLSPPAAALNGKVVIDPDLFDLNRVEVLRGPQGTLYGSGSMGGTIKLVTQPPNLTQYSGAIEGLFSGTDGGGINGGGNIMANFPIVNDKLALRIDGTEKYTSGWIDRIVVGPFPLESGSCPGWYGYGCVRGNVAGTPVQQVHKNVNDELLSGARADLLAKPIDNLTIDTLAMFQQTTMGGYSEYDDPPGNNNVLAHYQPYNFSEPFSDIFRLISNSSRYAFDWGDLTLASSYWTREEKQTMDDSESIQNLTGLNYFVPIGYLEADYSRQWSEELRLASPSNQRLQWLIGGFYSDLTSRFTAWNANPALAYISTGGAAANPSGIIYSAQTPYHLEQFAAFGQVSYQITHSIRATVGLRYFDYNSTEDIYQNGWGEEYGNATPQIIDISTSSSGVTPSFNVSWIPNGDLTVYATASKGFRPGGVNLPGPVSTCGNQPVTYQPDSVWNYELGEKARLFGNRLTVNSDFFYINWKGTQQILVPSCGYPYTTNAGTAESYGPELEVSAQLTNEITATGSFTHTDATITSPDAGTGIAKGTPVLSIPKYNADLALQYERQVWDNYDFTARASGSFVGPSTDIAYVVHHLQPYTLLDIRVGLSRSRWNAYLFGTNLTNKHAEITTNNTSFSWVTPSLTRVSTNQPRTIGIDLTYKF
jgi:outer membrane receptor protein involved in Fe transport